MQKLITTILLATLSLSMFTMSSFAQATGGNGQVYMSSCPSLDIDGDGQVQPYVDGILLNRLLNSYILDANLLNGVTIGSGAVRTTVAQMKSFVDANNTRYDFDGDGRVLAGIDGLLAIRYELGITESAMTSGITTNASPSTIIERIKAVCAMPAAVPTSTTVDPKAELTANTYKCSNATGYRLSFNNSGSKVIVSEGYNQKFLYDAKTQLGMTNSSNSQFDYDNNGKIASTDISYVELRLSSQNTFAETFSGAATLSSGPGQYTLECFGPMGTMPSTSSYVVDLISQTPVAQNPTGTLTASSFVCYNSTGYRLSYINAGAKTIMSQGYNQKFVNDSASLTGTLSLTTLNSHFDMNNSGGINATDVALARASLTSTLVTPEIFVGYMSLTNPNTYTLECFGPLGTTPATSSYAPVDTTVCSTDYTPVCGQPKSSCSSKLQSCTQQLPETYRNTCELNKAGATFISSGVCGGDDTTKGVQVSLAPTQPNQVLLGGSANPMQKLADFVFNGTGVVTDIKLIRTGVSTNQTLTNVYLTDPSVTGTTNTLLGNTTVQNDGTIYFKNTSGLFSLQNSNKTISVKAEIASGHVGESVGVSLQGYALSNNSLTTTQLIGPNLAISGGVTNYCPTGKFTNADCICPNGQTPTAVVTATYGIQQYTCETATTMCTAVYKPVCGRARNSCDGLDVNSALACRPAPDSYTTYSNRCELDRAGAVYVSEGVCGGDDTTKGIQVSLAPNQPTGILSGVGVVIAKFQFSGTGEVASVDLMRTGVSSDDTLTNISVTDDAGNDLSGTPSQFTKSNGLGVAKINQVKYLFSLNGSTKTIFIKADVNKTSSSVGVSLIKFGVNTPSSFNGLTTSVNVSSPLLPTLLTNVRSCAYPNALQFAEYCMCPSGQMSTALPVNAPGYSAFSCNASTTCSTNYAPVCGRAKNSCDGRDPNSNTACRPTPNVYTTYSNRCELDKAGAVYVSEGACDLNTSTATTTLTASTPNPTTGAVSLTWKSLINAPVSLTIICPQVNGIGFKTDKGYGVNCGSGDVWAWTNTLGDSILITPTGVTPVTVTFVLSVAVPWGTLIAPDVKKVTVTFPVPNTQSACPTGTFTNADCVCPNGQGPNSLPSGTRIQMFTCGAVTPVKNYCPTGNFYESSCTCPLGTTMQTINTTNCSGSLFMCPKAATTYSCVATPGYETPPYVPTIPGNPTPTVCIEPTVNVGVGSRGSAVTTLQTFLNDRGYLTNNPTGYFGQATRAAVIKFQGENGINTTGFVGQLTRSLVKVKSCEQLIPIPTDPIQPTPVQASATSDTGANKSILTTTSFNSVTNTITSTTTEVINPVSSTPVSSIKVVADNSNAFTINSVSVDSTNSFTMNFTASNMNFADSYAVQVIYKDITKTCTLASFVPVANNPYKMIRTSDSVCKNTGLKLGNLADIGYIRIGQ